MVQQLYYDQKEIWDYDYMEDSPNSQRFKDIIDLIPGNIKSVLDVGCGNGSFLNYLETLHKFDRLVGIDTSDEALRHVKTEKIKGNSTNLPFNDKEFELVTCLEVLEHLSVNEYQNTISELRRVSSKFIILSVPNSEDLDLSLVKCPICKCRFNPDFHKRTYYLTSMNDLFQGAQNIVTKESGPEIKYRELPDLLKIVTQAVKINYMPGGSYCPQCEYHIKFRGGLNSRDEGDREFILTKSILRACRIFFRLKSKKRWIVSLYKII